VARLYDSTLVSVIVLCRIKTSLASIVRYAAALQRLQFFIVASPAAAADIPIQDADELYSGCLLQTLNRRVTC